MGMLKTYNVVVDKLKTNLKMYLVGSSGNIADVDSTGRVKVDVASITGGTIPLPTGAATAALQNTENIILTAIKVATETVASDEATAALQNGLNSLMVDLNGRVSGVLAGMATSTGQAALSLQISTLNTIMSQINSSTVDTRNILSNLLNNAPTRFSTYTLTLAILNSQYPVTLPAIYGYWFQNRNGNDVYFAYTSGQVSNPAGQFVTLKAGGVEEETFEKAINLTLYFAGTVVNDILELKVKV